MKILVVIDMQNDFLHGALKNEEGIKIIPNVVKRIKEYYAENMPVFATRDTHTEDYLSTQEGKKLPVVHCVKYAKGWQINQDVLDALGETYVYDKKQFPYRKMLGLPTASNYAIIFDKPTFGSEDLANYIKRCYGHIQKELEVELCGVCTDICVISNALLLKAHFPEVKIKAHSLCMAGVNVSKHNSAIDVLKSCHIEVI